MSVADDAKKAAVAAAVALPLLLGAQQAEALSSQDVRSLTYAQVSSDASRYLSKCEDGPAAWPASAECGLMV